jgi:PAS domain S-box-containing protein
MPPKAISGTGDLFVGGLALVPHPLRGEVFTYYAAGERTPILTRHPVLRERPPSAVKKDLRILVLEDVAADVLLMSHELRSGGLSFETKRVETREEFLREVERDPPDLILSDHGLPGFDGFAALALARDRCPETPFIFVTGSMGEELAIDSLRSGATDYVLKTRLSNLVPAVERALRLAEERMKRRVAEKQLRDSEERFRLLVSGVKDYAIFMLDPEGRISSWNAGAEHVLGYRAAEVIGRRFNLFYPLQDNEAGKPEADLNVAASEGRFENDGWKLRKGDAPFWAHVDIRALRDADGRLRGYTQVTRDATERKRHEEVLRKGEERYRRLVDLYPDALMVLHEGQIVFVNHAAQKLLGANGPEHLLGRAFADFVPAQGRDSLRKRLQQASTAGSNTPWKNGIRFEEERIVRPDGSKILVEMTATRLIFEDKPAVQVILHDVTGQRAAAAALRESEARKTAILETALDAIISIDQAGKIIEWNPAAERIFGYSRELALGRDLTGLIMPKSNEELHRKGLARFLQTGRGRMLGHRTEVMALRANGAEFPLELTVTRIPGDGPLIFTSFMRDITERRRTEESLRKSEERFRLLVESVEDYAIYMLDTHGRITTWNAGAERIMGFRVQEIIGRRFHRFYVTDDVERKKPDQALAVATAEGHFQDERWQVREDGSHYWANFVITALRDESGKLTGFSTIARDVTQRKNEEDEIRRLNAELERRVQERTTELQAAYQEMEAFSYSVSHDLRAPLVHIAGFVEMLKSDLGASLDEKSRRHLQTICDSTETMGRMIADLLTFSRIGRAEMHRIPFDLNETVKDVRRDLQAQMQNRKVTWIVPPLPQVYGDPFLLRQAVYNLLGNAVKYTRHRGEARIEITIQSNEREHVIGIKDNGAGFDMKYASKLFGVFQRLHSASEFEGTGIGLANVRRIIGRHGGRTWAEGALQGGASFYFSLPIVADDKA